MRILLITHSLATGGTDRVAVHIANGFARRFETTLLHVRKPTAAGLVDMIDPAVQRISLEQDKTSRALDLVAASAALVREVRRLKPDVIIATGNNNSLFSMVGHLANPNRAGRFAVKITNPVVRAKDKWFKRAFRTALYRFVLGRCAQILALSSGEARMLTALYPSLADRVRVVHNPYVTDAMIAVGDRRNRDAGAGDGRSDGAGDFLTLGRLHPQKNLPLLLDAWAAAGLRDVRLKIAGEGALLDSLVARARSLGIEGTVDFLGYRSDVPELLSTAQCLVLSSDYEGLPAVALEAFAAGCPVVSTDCFPAAAELVGGAPGCRLVPRRDVAALAAALRDVAATPTSDVAALQARARPYAVGNAVESHIAALSL